MADNVAITAGSGTSVATDDIGGVHHQRVKLGLGADGTAVDAVAGAGAVGTGVQRVTLASDDPAVTSLAVLDDWDESDRAKTNIIVGQAGVDGGSGAVTAKTQRVTSGALEYETVAASQTDQVLGATGAAGDYLSHIIIQPATTGAGTVTVKDNTTVIYTFTTGTLADIRSIIVPFGVNSVSGAWKVTTGANVAVIGVGDFT